MFELQWVYNGIHQATTRANGLHLVQIVVSLLLNVDITEITLKRVKE